MSLVGAGRLPSTRTGSKNCSRPSAAATNVVTNLVLVPHFGLRGAAYASVVSWTLAMLATALLGRRQMKLPLPARPTLTIAIGSASMALVLWCLRDLRGATAMLIQISAGAITYGLILWLFDFVGLRANWRRRANQSPVVDATAVPAVMEGR